jgi:predicted neuraminidase
MHNKLKRKTVPISFLILTLIYLNVYAENPVKDFKIGKKVGTLTLFTLDGRYYEMSNYHLRQGTILLFMSSRSPTMRKSLKVIKEIHEKYRRQEILFIGLCPNDDETSEEIKAFCLSNKLNFPVYRDVDGKIAKLLSAEFTPEVFLLNKKSEFIYRGGFIGPNVAKELDDIIPKYIAGRPLPVSKSQASGTPITETGKKGDESDPIEPVTFFSEFIFEKIPWAGDHHCSTITEAANGDLLCVWYGGSYECADDQVLFISRREKGIRIWSKPQILIRGEFLHPPGNAVIFPVNNSRLMVFWDRMDEVRPIRKGSWGKGQLMYRYSDDNGYTWSEDWELQMATGGIRNTPVKLQTSELMVPMSGGESQFLITKDGGANWEHSGKIDRGGQPTVIQRDDGSLLAYLRSRPFILQSESKDMGKTWSPAHTTDLKCPGASMALCRLRNGHVVLVFNNSSILRTPLSVALSTDDGKTWSQPVALESNPGEYAYPCMIQSSDGNIHVTYTYLRKVIKHVEFNERWITNLIL